MDHKAQNIKYNFPRNKINTARRLGGPTCSYCKERLAGSKSFLMTRAYRSGRTGCFMFHILKIQVP